MAVKKPLPTRSRTHHRLVGSLLIAFGILVAVVILMGFGRSARHANRYDNPAIIKQLVIQSVENSKYDAPIDARSGDSYFVDSKLMIPHTAEMPRLTYSFQTDTKVLQISSRQSLARAVAVSSQATTTTKFFDTVPQLQACSRGVTILAATPTDAPYGRLRATVDMSDGSKRYLFSEDACPYLDPVIDAAKLIKLY